MGSFTDRLYGEPEATPGASFTDRLYADPAPIPQPEPVSNTRDFFTGENRQTRATEELPSLYEVGVSGFLGGMSAKGVPSAPALLLTYEPEEAAKILSWASGENVGVSYDEKGNAMLSRGDMRVMFNPPGFDLTDAAQIVGGGAAFSPAGLAGLGRAAASGIARVGAASGATQAAVEAGQAAVGGDFDLGEIPVTAAFGAVGQGIASVLVRAVPALRQVVRESGITEEAKRVVRETAVRLGFKPEEITDEVIAQMGREAGASVSPETAIAVQGEQEFAIPLTRAQRSLDDAGLYEEDMMRAGARGQPAQRTMREFEREQQRPAVEAARDRLQGDLGGSPIASPRDAGSNVIAAVRGAEEAMDAAVREAYADVGEASLSVDGVRGLFRGLRNSLRGVEFDRSLPATKKLLADFSGVERTLRNLERRPGTELKPWHIQQVERWRRRINTAFDSAETPADRRQVMVVKEAFDGYMDDAVARGMIQGDQEALSSLKRARESMTEYASLFYPRNQKFRGGGGERDRAGALIQRIVYSNPTDEEVINAILAGKSFSARGGVQMAQRFKEILGPESPEWNQVRQAAFRRFIQTGTENGTPVISASRSLSAFNKAMNENESLVRELFSGEEISTIRRYLQTVRRTQPDIVRSRANPSGSGVTFMRELGDRVGRIFGVTGDPTFLMSSAGLEAASGVTASSRAREAIRPFAPIVTGRDGTQVIPAAFVSGAQAATQ